MPSLPADVLGNYVTKIKAMEHCQQIAEKITSIFEDEQKKLQEIYSGCIGWFFEISDDVINATSDHARNHLNKIKDSVFMRCQAVHSFLKIYEEYHNSYAFKLEIYFIHPSSKAKYIVLAALPTMPEGHPDPMTFLLHVMLEDVLEKMRNDENYLSNKGNIAQLQKIRLWAVDRHIKISQELYDYFH